MENNCVVNELAHNIMVLIEYATREGAGKPVCMYSRGQKFHSSARNYE